MAAERRGDMGGGGGGGRGCSGLAWQLGAVERGGRWRNRVVVVATGLWLQGGSRGMWLGLVAGGGGWDRCGDVAGGGGHVRLPTVDCGG